MDIKQLTPTDYSVWKPVKLELTINSVEEARLLYHCFNRIDLLDCILTGNYGGGEGTSYDTYNTLLNFKNNEYLVIEKIIQNQGFEV